MKGLIFSVLVVSFLSVFQAEAPANEVILYDFEKDPQGWSIPDWTLAKKDYVGEGISVSEFQASNGRYSLEFKVGFPSLREWRGAYIECPVDIQDWSNYGSLEADIFLPPSAPKGLRAKLILTIGPEWKWTEMNRAVKLEPGEWTVIKVDLKPGSLNWRSFITDEFRQDVKKIGVRIESNGGIIYRGPVYIDNVKLAE